MQYREIKGDKCSANAKDAPVSQTCNSCVVGRWTDCSGGMQYREVTSFEGGIPCTATQNVKSRTCDSSPASWENPHRSYPGCYIGDWSECINERQFREIDGCWSDDKKNRLPEGQTCSSPDTYITVYPEPNYQGTGVKLFPPSWYNMYTLIAVGIDDNNISSIKVQPGVKATIYEGSHFTGNSKLITSDQPNVANIGFNKSISSIHVELIKVQPDVLQPNILQPDVVQPNILQPDEVQSVVVQPNVLLPNVLLPNVLLPDVVQSGVVQPNVLLPNILQPDFVQSDVQPDVVQPNVLLPNVLELNVW